MTADLQWKIEDGFLWVQRSHGGLGKFWVPAESAEAAPILQSAILATQEKCAQVAQNYGHGEFVSTMRSKTAYDIASAIRSLNLETGHE